MPIVEEGFAKHKIAEEVIDYYLASMTDIDTMILRCTHYPDKKSLGDGIQLVNPAYETAMELKKLLREMDLSNEGQSGSRRERSGLCQRLLSVLRKRYGGQIQDSLQIPSFLMISAQPSGSISKNIKHDGE